MDTRAKTSAEQVKARQQMQENQRAIEFAQRQLAELTAGASRTLRDAVITVDKGNANAAGKVRLNYLVAAATWQPQYKLRAGKEKDPVQLEYLAAIVQQSGEDWSDVAVTLSTAEPMLNAAPPELLVAGHRRDVGRRGAAGAGAAGRRRAACRQQQADAGAGQLRAGPASSARQAQRRAERQPQRRRAGSASTPAPPWSRPTSCSARTRTDGRHAAHGRAPFREGPSVTYHLKARLTVPSRNDQQLIEVARIELTPDYFYKAVPVLTPHVYRLATLTNTSEYVLLPGEATMYQGTDFVGRMNLPLVAIGEQFTVGFGVDPQLQVARELVDKTRTVQGGNQVHTYEYRIRVSSYKPAPVTRAGLGPPARTPRPRRSASAS